MLLFRVSFWQFALVLFLDEEALNKQKYNLIREIKSNYSIDDFFKAKIDNYKLYASIYTVFESQKSKDIDTKHVFLNKVTILEHISQDKEKAKENKNFRYYE